VLPEYKTALIIGAGVGISASLARALSREGLKVGLVGRNPAKLQDLATETSASVFSADASDPAAVSRLFKDVDTRLGEIDVVVYNPSTRAHGSVAEIDPLAVLGRSGGSQAHDPAQAGRDSADGGNGEHQGLCTVVRVRDG
jgi:short-subunit dehydrogenase